MEIFEIVTYFVLLLLITTAVRVVTTSNVIHAAISLVFTLALTSVLFLLLSTEFVALVLVLVYIGCLLYTSPSPRDATLSRMPSSA